MNWTPLGADPKIHHTLVEGVPAYMRSPLRAWFYDSYSYMSSTLYKRVYDIERIRRYDLASRGEPLVAALSKNGPNALFNDLSQDEVIRILDWTVFDYASSYTGTQRNLTLEDILRAGSSAWKVGQRDGMAGLERRVPEGVQAAAEAAMKRPGDAGRLLSEAWHAVYGVDPQPDLGYRKSIEAVEAAALPLVLPNDDTAHLGKAISQMRADGDWKLPFVKEHKLNPSGAVVINMMQALWSGHSDRHPGTASYVQSTQAAAEAAVSLSVTCVNLFVNGGIGRRP